MRPGTDELAAFLAGFVAAEGCFTGASPRRFTFSVGLGSTDAHTCRLMAAFLGVGRVYDHDRRRSHYDDETVFAVQSLRELVEVLIPFMDVHLPESYKRAQYLAWRAELLEYWEHRAKRVRACTVDGCEAPRRAHGLCRHHLFALRGQ